MGRPDLLGQPGELRKVLLAEAHLCFQRWVLERGTDLAITRFGHAPPGMASRAVARERGVLAVPSDHPVAAARPVSFAELRGEPFIALPEALGSAVRALVAAGCHAAGFAPDIVQTAPDSWTCVALVAAGVGLHFTTDAALEQMTLDGVRAVAIEDEIPPIFGYLVWRSATGIRRWRGFSGSPNRCCPLWREPDRNAGYRVGLWVPEGSWRTSGVRREG